MDFSWLSDLFHGILKIFSPLKAIAHWKIWHELIKWYEKFKKWRDWFRDHVLAPLRKEQAILRKLENEFALPIVKFVDKIRQITQLVGVFDKKLASKINYLFLKVEGYILEPFNKATHRLNALGMAIQGIVTYLGYLDRATLVNSIWRDAKILKGVLHNPLGATVTATTPPPGPTVDDYVGWMNDYMDNDTGPFADAVDGLVIDFDAGQPTLK